MSIMSTQILNAILNVVLPGVDSQTNVANVFEEYVLVIGGNATITHNTILIKQLITSGNLKFRLATVSRDESAEIRGSYSNFSGCCTITKLATPSTPSSVKPKSNVLALLTLLFVGMIKTCLI